jgi:hypothetical protein
LFAGPVPVDKGDQFNSDIAEKQIILQITVSKCPESSDFLIQ